MLAKRNEHRCRSFIELTNFSFPTFRQSKSTAAETFLNIDGVPTFKTICARLGGVETWKKHERLEKILQSNGCFIKKTAKIGWMLEKTYWFFSSENCCVITSRHEKCRFNLVPVFGVGLAKNSTIFGSNSNSDPKSNVDGQNVKQPNVDSIESKTKPDWNQLDAKNHTDYLDFALTSGRWWSPTRFEETMSRKKIGSKSLVVGQKISHRLFVQEPFLNTNPLNGKPLGYNNRWHRSTLVNVNICFQTEGRLIRRLFLFVTVHFYKRQMQISNRQS